MGFRMLQDFMRVQRWERSIRRREDHSEGIVVRSIRMIPWSGVAMFFFIMVFFGFDLGAGIKQTAQQIKDKKKDAQTTLEVQKIQARQWSVEQVKNFREGEMPQPSWEKGGPRAR
ncbi:conserved hypothetical protein [Leishmania mexicana MHOM/GT/2001/U1103]|uniref:Uncharacterized protein n=1 Tax=Leishmania mexicana (strain MHOM/GT/2001/U1103) TaxID=929439 RepID=E9B3B6_LEIMU|nr:conserved hypothetical protein [Leishmania mexicana MHOM/GT/2001/U1103]CBZ29733.1 conserved hypothetical protein [Leishmania mexicana MHOM/GT/2001/U1103]